MVHADLINFNAQMENVLRCVMYVIKMTIVETIQMNNRIANVSTKDDLLSRMILFILMMHNFSGYKALYNELEDGPCPRNRKFFGHPKFGMLVFSPVVLNIMFSLYHWWQIEKNWLTLPLVLLQLWPQYRVAKILYLGLWKRDHRWKEKHEAFERNVSSLGELIENTSPTFC